jgi:endonuclease YncB( thermonuclease family)
MPGGVSAICHMGPIDIAALLTREGLTELDGDADDSELVNAQAAAKSRKLGIWDR